MFQNIFMKKVCHISLDCLTLPLSIYTVYSNNGGKKRNTNENVELTVDTRTMKKPKPTVSETPLTQKMQQKKSS